MSTVPPVNDEITRLRRWRDGVTERTRQAFHANVDGRALQASPIDQYSSGSGRLEVATNDPEVNGPKFADVHHVTVSVGAHGGGTVTWTTVDGEPTPKRGHATTSVPSTGVVCQIPGMLWWNLNGDVSGTVTVTRTRDGSSSSRSYDGSPGVGATGWSVVAGDVLSLSHPSADDLEWSLSTIRLAGSQPEDTALDYGVKVDAFNAGNDTRGAGLWGYTSLANEMSPGDLLMVAGRWNKTGADPKEGLVGDFTTLYDFDASTPTYGDSNYFGMIGPAGRAPEGGESPTWGIVLKENQGATTNSFRGCIMAFPGYHSVTEIRTATTTGEGTIRVDGWPVGYDEATIMLDLLEEGTPSAGVDSNVQTWYEPGESAAAGKWMDVWDGLGGVGPFLVVQGNTNLHKEVVTAPIPVTTGIPPGAVSGPYVTDVISTPQLYSGGSYSDAPSGSVGLHHLYVIRIAP